MQTQQIKDVAGGLASFGRYGDTYMVHAAEGETVVPAEILDSNPELKQQLFRQMQMMGIENPNRYVVGSTLNSINPITGQPEFFFKKIFKFAKKALPYVAAAYAGNAAVAGLQGMAGAQAGGRLAGFLGGAGKALRNPFTAPGGIGGFLGGRSVTLPTASTAQNPLNVLPATISQQQQFVSGQPVTAPRKGIFSTITGGLKSLGNFITSPMGRVLGGAASAAIPSYLGYKYAKKFQEEQEDPETIAKRQRAVDPVGEAGERYFAMTLDERRSPEGQETAAQAGIRQMTNKDYLRRSTGLSDEEANRFIESMYPRQQVFAAGGGEIIGPGTGTSDSIPARLSDGEYVMTASAVRGAGNGNRDLGAARMYDLMSRFEGMA